MLPFLQHGQGWYDCVLLRLLNPRLIAPGQTRNRTHRKVSPAGTLKYEASYKRYFAKVSLIFIAF
jgi:hypothetical protein